MGPTSGAHHDCCLKRTLGPGSADQNGTRALTTMVAALNQGSWAGDQGTTTAQGVGGSVASGGGSDGSCRRWRREQGRRKQKRQGLRALAMVRAGSAVTQSGFGSGRTVVAVATGTGGYGHWCGSGRRQRRLWKTRARLWLRWLGEEKI